MGLHNVQKTGNMHYIYLPTKWCRDKCIRKGSRVEVELDSSGNIVLSATQKADSATDIKIELSENDIKILSKLIIACFINPVRSFEIDFEGVFDQKRLINDKDLMRTTFMEIDEHRIYSEPIYSVNNPLSLCISMVKRIRNLIQVIMNSNDSELLSGYKEEINHSNIIINKATISSMMHRRESKLKLVELHYISRMSLILGRITEHLVQIDKLDREEKNFLKGLHQIIEKIIDILTVVQTDSSSFNHNMSVSLCKDIRSLKIKQEVLREALIKTNLMYCGEILLDWSITNMIQD